MSRLLNYNWFYSVTRFLSWRVGRKIYMASRGEQANKPESNGEYALLREAINRSPNGATLFDIGANRGEWTLKSLELGKQLNVNLCVHLFEPAKDSFAHLENVFQNESVHLNNVAISNKETTSKLFVRGSICGVNSLYADGEGNAEFVDLIRFDDYFNKADASGLIFVKSDTEGHDFEVIQGAHDALKSGKIDFWQFEYNFRWVHARRYLKDVFEYVVEMPYCVGKLSSHGIELYEDWHPELERFFECNYVLVRKDWVDDRGLCVVSGFDNCNVPKKVVRRC